MVYDANPISKEQLEFAINDQLESAGLPNDEQELTDFITEQLESAGLPTDEEELIDFIAEHSEGSDESYQLWVGSYDPTDYISPILPMDCEINFNNEKNADLVTALRACTFHPYTNGKFRISQFMFSINSSNTITVVKGTDSQEYSTSDALINALTRHGPYHFEWAFESGTAIGWCMGITGDAGGAVSLTTPWQHRVYINRMHD